VCIGRGQVLRIQECARELKPLRFTAVSLAHARGPKPLLEGGMRRRPGFGPIQSPVCRLGRRQAFEVCSVLGTPLSASAHSRSLTEAQHRDLLQWLRAVSLGLAREQHMAREPDMQEVFRALI
jgi:hypothetical protein